MRKLAITLLCLALLTPAFAEHAALRRNIVAARFKLWGKLDKNPSIHGVGEGHRNGEEVLVVYLNCWDTKTLDSLPHEFKRFPVEVNCTDTFKDY